MQEFGTFVLNHWILFLALVIILGLIAASYLSDKLLGFKELQPQQVTQKINHDNAVVLDVREDKEFKEGHIVNAVHAPLSKLEGSMNKFAKYKERPLIVTCQNGQRSARACALLRKQGFENVFKLGGGLMAWRDAKYPLITK